MALTTKTVIEYLDKTPLEGRFLFYDKRNGNEFMHIRVVLDLSGSGFDRSQWTKVMNASYQSNVKDRGLIYDPRHFPETSPVSFGEHYQGTEYSSNQTAGYAPSQYAHQAQTHNVMTLQQGQYQESSYRQQSNYPAEYKVDYHASYQPGYRPDTYQHSSLPNNHPMADQNPSCGGGGGFTSPTYFPSTGESSLQGAWLATLGASSALHSQQPEPELEPTPRGMVPLVYKKVVFMGLPRKYDKPELREFVYRIVGEQDAKGRKRNISLVILPHPDGGFKGHAYGICRDEVEAAEVTERVHGQRFKGSCIRVQVTQEGISQDGTSNKNKTRPLGSKQGEKGRERDKGRSKVMGKGKGKWEEMDAEYFDVREPVVVDGTSKTAAEASSFKRKGKGKSHDYKLVDRTRRP